MWGNARLPTGVRVIGVNSVWMVWELTDATLYCLGAHFHPEARTLRKRYPAECLRFAITFSSCSTFVRCPTDS